MRLERFPSLLKDIKPSDPEFLDTIVFVSLLKTIKEKDFAEIGKWVAFRTLFW